MSGTLFVSREDEVEVGRAVDGVEDGQNGTSGVTNCSMVWSDACSRAHRFPVSKPELLTDVFDTLP